MNRRSAFDAVSLAFEHVRRQLLPFRWSQWWRLAVLGIVAGEAGVSGCQVPGAGGTGSSSPGPASGPPEWLNLAWLADHLATVLFIVACVVIVAGLLLLLWTYLSSVCRFILIDALVTRRCDGIRTGWRKWRDVGRQFFVWQLLYQLVVFLLFVAGASVAVALVVIGLRGDDRLALVGLIAAAVVSGLVFLVLAKVVAVLAKDFMAPILALDREGFRPAWRRLMTIMRADPWGFAGYLGVKVLMSIALGLLLVIAVVVTLAPIVLVGLVLAVGWSAAGLPAVSGAGLLVVGVIVAGVVLAATIVLLNVPLTVFFPAYGLHFLGPRYALLDAWLNPPRAEDAGSP